MAMDKHHPRMSSRHIWSHAGSGWRQFPTDPIPDSTSYVPCTWGDLHWWISPSWQVKPITNSTFNNSLSFEALKNFFTRVDIEGIPNPSITAPNVLETSLSPVELLDILGLSGHRVVGVASKHNRMVNYFRDDNLWYISHQVWTLERENDHSELWRLLSFWKCCRTDWIWLILDLMNQMENIFILCQPSFLNVF